MKNLTKIAVSLMASSAVQDFEIEALQIDLETIDLPGIIVQALRAELDKYPQMKVVKVTALVHG